MTNRKPIIAILIAAAAAASSQAAIIYGEYSEAGAVHYDDEYLFYNWKSGPPTLSWSSPFTSSTSANGTTMSTVGSVTTGEVASTSDYLHIHGAISGQVSTDFSGTGYPDVEVYMLDQVEFDTDVATSVTFVASGTSGSTSGSGQVVSLLYIDGVISTSPVNGTHTVAIAAGSHKAYYDVIVMATQTAGSATFSGNYDMIIGNQAVPEPTSMGLLGVGAVALIRRRIQR